MPVTLEVYPNEFREDTDRINHGDDAPVCQVAADFGLFESCLHCWIRAAEQA